MDPTLEGVLTAILTALFTFLATLYAAVYPLQRKHDALVRSHEKLVKGITYWRARDFDVVLDGVSTSGKSALVARWINPTSDVSALGRTGGLAMQGPVHMCSDFYAKDDTRYEDRYRLIIHDVGGEFEAALAQVFVSNKVRAAVLVIDPTQLDKSLTRFSASTLQRTYLMTSTLDHLSCIMIYISKRDLVHEDQLRTAEARVRAELLPVIAHRFSEGNKNLMIFSGSATTGERIFESQAFLAEQLGFAKFFQAHKSLAH